MKFNQLSSTCILLFVLLIFNSHAQDAFITTWITDLSSSPNNSSITIPTFGTGYNYDVDWDDDGIFDAFGITGDTSHDYGSPDTVTIRIQGDFPRIYFLFASDAQKLIAVNQWGSTQWTTMESAFNGCTNLVSVGLDTPDLSMVTNCEAMFRNCLKFNAAIDHWDMSSVSILSNFLRGATVFNQPLNNWNVARVRLMDGMLYEAENFNQSLNAWVTDSVTDMTQMFREAAAFDSDISAWNVSQVSHMGSMFFKAQSFNQNLANWDVVNVFDFSYMFADASSFDQNVGTWDVGAGTSFSNMFDQSGLSTTNYDSLLIGWARLDAGEVQIPMNENFGASGLHFCAGDSAWNQLSNTHGWTITDAGKSCLADHLVLTWITILPGGSNNSSITIPTFGSGYNYDVDWDNDGRFDEFGITGDKSHAYSSPRAATVRIKGDFPRIYFSGATDRKKLVTVEQWGTTQWTSMESAFHGCSNLLSIGLDTPDLSDVTDCSSMFLGCTKFNTSINHWDMSAVTNLSHFLSNASTFNQPLDHWDVQRVKLMEGLFQSAEDFNQNLAHWELDSVTNFSNMFNGASSFNQNLGSWNISAGAQFENMLDLSGLSRTHYDSLLIGWARLDNGEDQIPINGNLGATGIHYCTGDSARNQLINTHGWAITDEGKDCLSDHLVLTWNTNNSGTSNNSSITIPIEGTGYNYDVDWDNDGIFDTLGITTSMSYDYDTPAIVTIRIRGDFPRIFFHDKIDRNKLIAVEQWGSTQWFTMKDAFRGCLNLVSVGLDTPDMSGVSNCEFMFDECSKFNAPIGHWDMSSITNLGFMFRRAYDFNQPLNNWDVQRVKSMASLFYFAENFNQNLDQWDVSSVMNYGNMFSNATSFNQSLSSWDISSALVMILMLDDSGLSTVNYDSTLIGWARLDSGEVSIPMNLYFGASAVHYCAGERARDTLINTLGWGINDEGKDCLSDHLVLTWKTNITGVSNKSSIIIPIHQGLVYNYDIDWDNDGIFDTLGINSSITHDFGTPATVTIRIRGDFLRIYFFGAEDRHKLLAVNQWGTTSWTSMEGAFRDCINLSSVGLDTPDLSGVSSCQSMFHNCFHFNSPIDHWDMSSITTVASMFREAPDFNQPLNNWNIQNVRYMNRLFFQARNFNQDLDLWQVDSVSNMNSLFHYATSFNRDITNWNVSHVTDMKNMFNHADAFNQPLNNWDVSNVKRMDLMFQHNDAFNQPINNWDVHNVKSTEAMFLGADSFNQNLDQWDVDSIENYGYMFSNASSFNQNLANWDISSAITMNDMFGGSGLSTAKYDSTLIGWARFDSGELQIPTNVDFSAFNIDYCIGDSARQSLITDHNWMITDGVKECSNTWVGALSSDWFDFQNWSHGVPRSINNVVIPLVGTNFYPIISEPGANCKEIETELGATLECELGWQLEVGSD